MLFFQSDTNSNRLEKNKLRQTQSSPQLNIQFIHLAALDTEQYTVLLVFPS